VNSYFKLDDDAIFFKNQTLFVLFHVIICILKSALYGRLNKGDLT